MEQLRPQVNSQEPAVSLATLDVLHAESMRARDLLAGAVAMLRDAGGGATYELVAAARVSAIALVDTIERAVSVEHERQRSEQQRLHSQAAKSVGAEGAR